MTCAVASPSIMVAPTGARRSKSDHPALPLTLSEIVATALACQAVGADALHLHVRNDEGCHSLDVGRYREALDELAQAAPTLPVQITTEAAGLFTVAEQLTCLEQLRPAWASLSIREIARDVDLAARVYATCEHASTDVQHIAYDAADLTLLRAWQAQGIVRPGQQDVICVLGRYSDGQIASPADLDHFLPYLTVHGRRMLCAFGPQEHACLAAATGHGFDLRVGFENSLTDAQGRPHKDNAASVAALIDNLSRSTP